MSQMVTRKRTGGDEKEKRQTDSPVKEMKKKMAANAEKEKNATEKPAETATEKPAEKPAEKAVDMSEKPKPTEKAPEKPAEKKIEKPAEKKNEKPAEKKSDAQSEKKKEEGKAESSGKTDKPEKKPDARDSQKPKQNGSSNGVNGTVSGAGDSDSDELVIDENDENDEQFPELAYDDSDVEWEPGADAPSRSLTRRSQVKVTRTPETPRPASDKQADEQSKDSKVLKLTQESGKSDSPKPEAKKPEPKTDAKKPEPKTDAKKPEPKTDAKKPEAAKDAKQDSPKSDAKKPQEAKESPKEDKKQEKESPRKEKGEKWEKGEKSDRVEVEVIVDIESSNEPTEQRKPDTNYSKSRVKVSPYRRSSRLADQTTSSVTANYTGNNTTMEMDITESSSIMEATLDDSSYLSGLRSIRGRRSYKPLKEMSLRNVSLNWSARSATSTVTLPESSRPTGTVVGRKRKPDADEISLASEADEFPAAGKRQRLIERLARPFRPFRRAALLPARRNAEIVGINTDLPLTAPVASADSFDPEALKTDVPSLVPAPAAIAASVPEDSKRCVVM